MTIGSQNPVPSRRRLPVAGLGFLTVVILGIGPVFHGAVLAAEASKSRIAIVISNGDYSELGPLRNPVADGQLVASALRNAGFNVTYLKNLKDEQFRKTLRQVARDSSKADVTLVYYAGHGAQVGGTNYLLPVDIPHPEQEDDIRLASVSADEVLSVIKSPYKILILDACRDNPILGRALSRGRGASYKSGLAPVAPPAEAAGGVFIAYSTQTNAIAIDGEGANSPFAQSFAEHVGSRTSIDDMFALVTRDVLKKTNGFQRPFKYASLDTVFCLTVECPSGSKTITSALQTSLTFGNSVQDAFASLTVAKSPDARSQIEEELWQQLRNALPKRVAYGSFTTPDGKNLFYGFEPATTSGDGHHALATVRTGEFTNGALNFNESESEVDSLDCDAHQMWRSQSEINGGIRLFSRAEQKAAMAPIKPGSVGESLELTLCSTPMRITPLWAVDELRWVPIGQAPPQEQGTRYSFAAAPAIFYRDPTDGSLRYLFVRALGDKPDNFGAEKRYGWLAINCGNKQFRDAGSYGLTNKGLVVSVLINSGNWMPAGAASPAANAYVLLCDQSQDGK